MDGISKFKWMGRLDLHLLDQEDRTIALVELSVRDEFITAWYSSRTLSVFDRDAFVDWFWNPFGNFTTDDITWSVQGSRLCLAIDGSAPFFAPEAFVQKLVSVL